MADEHRANLELSKIILRNGIVPPSALKGPLDEAHDKKLSPKQFMELLVTQGVLNTEQAHGIWADFQGDSLPDSVADFQILSQLGKGGMGVVYRAARMGDGEIVALKVMRPSKTVARTSLDRFYREANAMIKLQHPNIVRGIACGEVEGRHYMAMEYVSGEALNNYEKDGGKIPPGQATYVAIGLARALAYAHTQQLVHRDVKPNNVIISATGEVKLTDFGLSKWEEDAGANLTMAGSGMGTPYYMAPEQVRGAKFVDGRSDIYSLGATLYEMLTGRKPIEGKPMQVLLKLEQGERIPPVRELEPSIPERLAQIVAKMMAHKPEDRYQTSADAAHDLEEFAATLSPEAFNGPLPIAPDRAMEMTKETGATCIGMPAVKRQKTAQHDIPTPPAGMPAMGPPDDVLYFVKYRKPDGSPFIKPYDREAMRYRVEGGRFNGTILVRKGQEGEFVRLDTIPELNEMLMEVKTLVPQTSEPLPPPAPPKTVEPPHAPHMPRQQTIEEAATVVSPHQVPEDEDTPINAAASAPPVGVVMQQKPASPAKTPPAPARPPAEAPPQPAGMPKWIYGALGGMGLIIVILLILVIKMMSKM
ncbi:MAG TPA: serine/threonine-protein kinase [Candidatus Brocadiia bacterium]|nr:serine/threonine-protein kinase [Candidatus Brocadiia bacterium]